MSPLTFRYVFAAAAVVALSACGSAAGPSASEAPAQQAAASSDLQARIAEACGWQRGEIRLGTKIGVAGANLPSDAAMGRLHVNQATSDYMQNLAVTGVGQGYMQEWIGPADATAVYMSSDETVHCSADGKTQVVAQ